MSENHCQEHCTSIKMNEVVVLPGRERRAGTGTQLFLEDTTFLWNIYIKKYMLISRYTYVTVQMHCFSTWVLKQDTFCMSAGVYAGFSRDMYILFSHVSSTACMNTRLQAHVHMHVFLWNSLASMQALGKCSVRHYVDRCRCNASSNLQKPVQTSSFHMQSQNWSVKNSALTSHPIF